MRLSLPLLQSVESGGGNSEGNGSRRDGDQRPEDQRLNQPDPTEPSSANSSVSEGGGEGLGVPAQDQQSPDRMDLGEEDEEEEEVVSFPVEELMRLDDMIARIRWVVPVLPRGELETLLNACIELAKRGKSCSVLFHLHLSELPGKQLLSNFSGVDHKSEPCQKFIKEGLTVSFTRILTDEAVSGWKFDIHVRLLIPYANTSHPPCSVILICMNPVSENLFSFLCFQRAIFRNCERLVDLCVIKIGHDCYPLLDLLGMAFNPQSK